MAYPVNILQTAESVASTSYTVSLGAHVANDLLLVLLTQDTGTTAFSAPGGWAMLGTGAASGGCRSQWAWKIAASSSESAPTFTSGATSEEWISTCIVVRDADPTNPFGATPTSGTDFIRADYVAGAGGVFASGALTSATADTLLLYSWGTDGSRYQKCRLGSLAGLDFFRGAQTAHVVGQYQQSSAGAAPSVTCYSTGTAAGGNGWVIAIRNKSGGARAPDLRATVTDIGFYGGLPSESVTWQAVSNFAGGANINGIATSTTYTGTSALTNTTSPNSQYTGHGGTSATGNVWGGATHTFSATNFTNAIFVLQWFRSDAFNSATQGSEGVLVGFEDGTGNWATFQIRSIAQQWAGESITSFISATTATQYAASASPPTWTNIVRWAILVHKANTAQAIVNVKGAALIRNLALIGGGANRPAGVPDLNNLVSSWDNVGWATIQGDAQVVPKGSCTFGNGTDKLYLDASASAMSFPTAWSSTPTNNWQKNWNAGVNSVAVAINASANDTILVSACLQSTSIAQPFTIDSGSSTSATYSFVGVSIVGYSPTWKTGVPCNGAIFSRCAKALFKGASISSCTIKSTSSTDAACAFDANGVIVSSTTIDVSSTSASYHMELGASITAITLNGTIFTGTASASKIHSLATSGTVTITVDGTGTTLSPSDVTFPGGSTAVAVIASPTLERGQNFTGLITGSKVKVFTTGSTTVLYGTDSSGTSFTWDDASSGTITIDYTIQKVGYIPIRVTGVALTGVTGTGVIDTPIQQVIDRAYITSSGLTYGTTAVVNAGAKTFTLSTASTLQNLYSFWIEQWISKGGSGEALANITFPISPNGPNSFTLNSGWVFSDGATSIAFLSRDGLRYRNTSDAVTAIWAAILTVGVPSGVQVRYQQGDGGTTQSATITSGNMDQLVQILSDPNGDGNYVDGYNRTGYLVLKTQEMGFDQSEVDAVTLYGALEDQLYVIGLSPLANTVATGNPSLASPPAIVNHGNSPVTWNSKVFSVTITDSAATNTGVNIMRWLRYSFETGGVFQGTDAFNWHDLVQQNGAAFKTVRGAIYGDVGATLKGVRVVKNDGTTEHPDFTRFTADDGTFFDPVIPAVAQATILADTRVQLYNVTTDTEIDTTFETSALYSYTITTEASVGDTLRLRVCKKGRISDEAFAVWAASGVTFLVSQPEDTVYTAWGIDGDTVTEYSLDGPNLQIDANDVDGATQKIRLGAFYSAAMASSTSPVGIRTFFGVISFLSAAAIRVNTDIGNLYIENTNSLVALRFTDLEVRLYKSDGSTIIAATSYSIHNDYSGVPDVVETGTSGLTGAESAQLMSLTPAPSAATVAATVLTAAQSTPIHSNVKKMNDATVLGNGTSGDLWRG